MPVAANSISSSSSQRIYHSLSRCLFFPLISFSLTSVPVAANSISSSSSQRMYHSLSRCLFFPFNLFLSFAISFSRPDCSVGGRKFYLFLVFTKKASFSFLSPFLFHSCSLFLSHPDCWWWWPKISSSSWKEYIFFSSLLFFLSFFLSLSFFLTGSRPDCSSISCVASFSLSLFSPFPLTLFFLSLFHSLYIYTFLSRMFILLFLYWLRDHQHPWGPRAASPLPLTTKYCMSKKSCLFFIFIYYIKWVKTSWS